MGDTRSALSSVTLRWDERFAVDATLGADFPILALSTPRGAFGFGVTAQGNLGFQPNEDLRFDLETFDGTFGFPVDARVGPWSARLELAHTSAHFADGVRTDGERPGPTEGYSREWARLQVSGETGFARGYVGGGVLLHDTRNAPPLGVQVGGEIAPNWPVAPYLAVDVQMAAADAWAPACGAQVGVWAHPNRGSRARIALSGRYGPEDTGKLSGEHEAWVGILFGFDRTGRVSPPARTPAPVPTSP